jgi:DNA-binding beta-propeller fold protein YncE
MYSLSSQYNSPAPAETLIQSSVRFASLTTGRAGTRPARLSLRNSYRSSITRLPIFALFVGLFGCLSSFSTSAQAAPDTRKNPIVATIDVGGQPAGVAANPKKDYVYVATGTTSIAAIDTKTNALAFTLNASAAVGGLAVDPKGEYIWATDAADNLEQISIATNQVIGTLQCGSEPNIPAVSRSGKLICVPNSGDGTVTVFIYGQRGPGWSSATLSIGGSPLQVVLTPDGQTALISNETSILAVIDTTTLSVSRSVALDGESIGLAISANGDTCFVTGQEAIYEVSVKKLTLLATYPITNPSSNLLAYPGLTPNGDFLFAPNLGGNQVLIFDIAKRQVLGNGITVGTGPFQIAIIPNGKFAYVTNKESGTVTVLNVQYAEE